MGYHGSKYCGWQRQPGVSSVQEVIERKLYEILKIPVTIIGCGRTDTKVHASQFFFHMDVSYAWDFDLKFRLNKRLPDDIAIFDIIPVEETRHARFDATLRTYDYFMHTYKDPFLSNVSSLYEEDHLDIDSMKKAVALLPQYHDFRAFCKSPDQYRHTVCDISSACLYADKNGERLRLQIMSNRFLYRMIRNIVAKLLQVGRGTLHVAEFEHYLSTQEIPPDNKPAYPQGLFLSKVTYPYLDLPPRTEFSAILWPET